jgi:hypothetical protein
MLPPGGKWTLLHDWQTANTFDWATARRAPGTYELGVWVREAGKSTYEAYGFTTFTLGTAACSSAHVVPDTAEPAMLEFTIALTASSNGCTSPLYQFWYQPPGGKWTIQQPYSSSDTWNWLALGTPGTYQYGVRVKHAGSTKAYDAYYIGTFRLAADFCPGAVVGTNQASPLKPGNPVLFYSGSAGCPQPQVEYWVLKPNSSTWTVLRPYSAQTDFTWDTAGLGPGPYRIGVWVKEAGSYHHYDTYAQLTMWVGT